CLARESLDGLMSSLPLLDPCRLRQPPADGTDGQKGELKRNVINDLRVLQDDRQGCGRKRMEHALFTPKPFCEQRDEYHHERSNGRHFRSGETGIGGCREERGSGGESCGCDPTGHSQEPRSRKPQETVLDRREREQCDQTQMAA